MVDVLDLSYELKFDKISQNLIRFLNIMVLKLQLIIKSFLYLIGTTLDYSGGLNGKGFIFINPNANRTCGCGESFSL